MMRSSTARACSRSRCCASALWAAVARDRELLKPDVTDEEVKAICSHRRRASGSKGGAIALAIVAPRAAALGYLLIAVSVLRVRGDDAAAEPA
jgi:hypothetical protein